MDNALPRTGNLLIYQNERGDTQVDVYLEQGNLWMTQRAIAELYQVRVPTINYHIRNILADGELDSSTIRDYLIVQTEAGVEKNRNLRHFDFRMILAIGYRVRSNVGMHFRTWASGVLKEYTQKGFAMNDERLKNPKPFGEDYFDELLARIRDIRASEKRFYRKITDIYALSCDYDPHSDQAKTFFATVQNKLHYAVTGKTAAEIIRTRADATKPNAGATTFSGVKVRITDMVTAKNFLQLEESEALNRIVTRYLDYAEDQAKLHQVMHMRDWEQKLNGFLEFNEREVLQGKGQISMEDAQNWAKEQYRLFDEHRRALETQADLKELTDAVTNIAGEKKK